MAETPIKDLTGLIEYSKKVEETAPPAAPPEPIEAAAELALEPPQETPEVLAEAPGLAEAPEFAESSAGPPESIEEPLLSDMPVGEPPGPEGETPTEAPASEFSTQASDFPETPDGTSAVGQSEAPTETEAAAKKGPSKVAGNVIEKIRNYSEKATSIKASVQAAFPFSLLIEGAISEEEREKIVDIVTRENMGIREMDLEPQFESGRILIPRISEFAGVLLIQALRTISAKIRFGPSDQIFSASPENEREPEGLTTESAAFSTQFFVESTHEAEAIPVTTDGALAQFPNYSVVDVVFGSAVLKSEAIEAETSAEFHQTLEALHREVKFKAYRKGAQGILHFKVELTMLSSPTHYRMTVTGSAIKGV